MYSHAGRRYINMNRERGGRAEEKRKACDEMIMWQAYPLVWQSHTLFKTGEGVVYLASRTCALLPDSCFREGVASPDYICLSAKLVRAQIFRGRFFTNRDSLIHKLVSSHRGWARDDSIGRVYYLQLNAIPCILDWLSSSTVLAWEQPFDVHTTRGRQGFIQKTLSGGKVQSL